MLLTINKILNYALLRAKYAHFDLDVVSIEYVLLLLCLCFP